MCTSAVCVCVCVCVRVCGEAATPAAVLLLPALSFYLEFSFDNSLMYKMFNVILLQI